ncbi:hypothetical protein GCM10009663_36170 [Kitasatospora arboriphila]|uniref:Uncharacterized protein n=1 Tax=Kitasatospora arboriphila TaxID=258052 RepID=A0ABP4E5R6_9ACTN
MRWAAPRRTAGPARRPRRAGRPPGAPGTRHSGAAVDEDPAEDVGPGGLGRDEEEAAGAHGREGAQQGAAFAEGVGGASGGHHGGERGGDAEHLGEGRGGGAEAEFGAGGGCGGAVQDGCEDAQRGCGGEHGPQGTRRT